MAVVSAPSPSSVNPRPLGACPIDRARVTFALLTQEVRPAPASSALRTPPRTTGRPITSF